MTFQSIIFLPFIITLLSILSIIKTEKTRQYVILLSSVIFYGLWDWRSLALLIVSIVFVHCFGKILQARKYSRGICTLCISVLLLILGTFKYFNFFIAEFCALLGVQQTIALNLILPIGISFYIFSAIGYIIDIYRKEITESVPFYQEALYIMFFPKILQGPLHKATDFMKQLKKDHSITWRNISIGIQIFLFGLIKKIVIADRLGLFVDTVYATPNIFSGLTLLLAALTYPFQLYCDFSGYSDMAIGTAKMMGYDLCQNFNLPFLSQSVAEYWRRWHMSLNIWFRDYLFIRLYAVKV